MPEKFERYAIEAKLGQGGMAAVYLAVDQSLGRKVALKVITSRDKESLERFQREAQAIAKLRHPHIVQVYDVGVFGSQHYFTMEYIEGVSLEQMIESSPKPGIQNIAHIMMQVAEALDYAHQQDIVHRDVKPSNILIDKKGTAYLTDFGIAKQLSGLDRKLTLTGNVIGTVEYMSPEQTTGKSKDIDFRSDIFSLGTTLYHCITGRVPFEGGPVLDTISNIVNKDPKQPTTIIRWIPHDLETICLKCLEKDKTKRYQTASELVEDLRRYLAGEPILARRTMYLTKLWYKAKRNRTTALAVSSAVLIMIGVLVYRITSVAESGRKVKEYQQKAQECFEQGKYDDARVYYEKILEISSADEDIKVMRDKCNKILNQKAQEAEAKVKKDELRTKAKNILDRITKGATPDQQIAIAQDALKVDETYADALQALGEAYKKKREYDKAYKYFTDAINHNPKLAYSYYGRATITGYTWGRLGEAIADFEKVMELDPESHIGFIAKGNIARRQEKYDLAIEYYNRAIELSPEGHWAYSQRAAVYFMLGDTKKAVEDLTESIRFNPAYATAYDNRAAIYVSEGKYDLGIADCNKAIELEPDNGKTYHTRGFAYLKKGELDRALADLEKAIQLGKKGGEVYHSYGLVYYKKGDLNKAIMNYNLAIEKDQTHSGFYADRGRAYARKQELDKALADYTQAIKIDPQNGVAYNDRGNVYSNKGDLDKALEDYASALKLNPKDSMAYYNRGLVYERKGDKAQAMADYTESIKLDSNYFGAYNNRGIMYYNSGQLDKAMGDYNTAIKINPKYPDAYGNRANVYARKGDFKSAIADAEMFIKLTPQHPFCKELKAAIPKWRAQMNKQ